MKYTIFFICCILSIAALEGCHKSNAGSFVKSDTARTITLGVKWNLVQDSSMWDIGTGPTRYNIYNGGVADYWDFRSDGKLYIKEGATLDTISYKFLNGTNVDLLPSGTIADTEPDGDYQISFLSVHQATIRNGFYNSPGGSASRVIFLQR